jgi:rhamnogalacturonan acetylesterase
MFTGRGAGGYSPDRHIGSRAGPHSLGDWRFHGEHHEHRGWGDPFADYFDQEQAHTANRARAGRSSRTFITEG